MTLAVYKDLCLDAGDTERMAGFWAAVLGRRVEQVPDGPVLAGSRPEQAVWVNTVPEAKSVKNRVHLDVYAASLADLERLGAAVLDADAGRGRWTVMADPEGGEFCAFLRDTPGDDRLHGIVVDSADAVAQATWWGRVLGGEVVHHAGGWSSVQGVPGLPGTTLDFVPVPEAKTVKNRVHWDVETSDPLALLDAGATLLHARGGDLEWDVLADPEGNEFCAFVAPRPEG